MRLCSTFSHNRGQVHCTCHIGMIPLSVHSFMEPEIKGLWVQLTWRTTFSVCTSLHHALSSLCPIASLSSVRAHNILAECPCPPYLWSFLCTPVYLCPQGLSPCRCKMLMRFPSLQVPQENVAGLGLIQCREESAHASTRSLPAQDMGPDARNVRWHP